jgi:hypothetical protein
MSDSPSGDANPQVAPELVRRTRASARPPEAAPFDGEDFLFHLYRGSELLQDDCVEEAKEELERAIRMQPLDVEGQSLLGVVYFRLGLYPRAIEIYREIVKACPEEVTPKLNLALCYLKTGQPGEARDLLESLLRSAPDHRRAWGYLGLSLERLGEYERARAAFLRAEQPHLARRMQQLLDELAGVSGDLAVPREDVRRAAADALEEIDAAGDGPFQRAAPEPEVLPFRDSRWRAHEPGEEPLPPLPVPRRASLDLDALTPAPVRAAEGTSPRAMSDAIEPPLTPESLVSSRQLVPAELRSAVRTPSGLVFVRVQESFAVRADRLRATSPTGEGLRPSGLKRRFRGRELDEPFSALGASWSLVTGAGWLVLDASDRELRLVQLSGEFMYVREARLVGFSGLLRYENGRLPGAEPGPVPMVQLAGEGIVVFESRPSLGAISVSAEQPLSVRAASVLGWTGRLLGIAVPSEQAPHLGTGFVAFSGDGAVLLDDP